MLASLSGDLNATEHARDLFHAIERSELRQ